MTAIFVKSVRTATIAIFQFRIRGCIRFVAVAFRSEEVLWRRNPLNDLFLANCPPPPHWIRPWVEFAEKPINRCVIMSTSISIKFRKHPSSGSVGKADYVFQYIYMQ